jgi:hypothetical protein
MEFKEISDYWASRHPGRKVAGDVTEDSDPVEFFKIIDE